MGGIGDELLLLLPCSLDRSDKTVGEQARCNEKGDESEKCDGAGVEHLSFQCMIFAERVCKRIADASQRSFLSHIAKVLSAQGTTVRPFPLFLREEQT